MINLEQERAAFAFTNVKPNSKLNGFASAAKNLPAMIQSNGLLATWAFLLAKEKKSPTHKKLADILTEYYKTFLPEYELNDITRHTFFTEHLTKDGTRVAQNLMKLTAEAIAISGWIKRAAEALCEED